MDDAGSPKSSWTDSTKTTVGVLVALVVVLIVAGVGITSIRDAKDTIRRATDTTTTSTAPAPTAVTPEGELSPEQAALADEVKAEVAAIRGLAWKAPLSIKVMTSEQLAQRVRELTAEEVAGNRDDLAADESVLKLLQLIPDDLDYVKAFDDILSGAVRAFYDDETKEMVIGGVEPGPLDPATRSVLAHELTHALTDQHFDFGARTKVLDDEDRTEEHVAFSAVIEGDAELVRTFWEERHLTERERVEAAIGGTVDADAFAKAPPYLLESLYFPYQDGVSFVRNRHRVGGFAEVDSAYRNPPTSTEHILHPETYADGKSSSAPQLPDLAAATGCGKVDTGTLGEFDMRQLLAREISTPDARDAAAGWNGDAYGVVRCGAALGLADRWQADAPADAGQLADALGRWGRGWSGSTRAPDADGRFTGPSGSGRVMRDGGRVDLVLADDLATADRLAAALTAG